jgi:hypothetical protein
MLSVKEAVSLSAAHVSMGWTTKRGNETKRLREGATYDIPEARGLDYARVRQIDQASLPCRLTSAWMLFE